ncbi:MULTISPECIES: GCG_CRPN prefix-to-repeats domain-containing protein [Methylobacterium]|jgi:hypothetical protein
MYMPSKLAATAALLITGIALVPAAVAEAAPLGPLSAAVLQADAPITLVAQGCGPGFFRGPYGGCRPFYGRRRFYGPGPYYARRCFIRPTPFVPRRFCRF